VTFEEGLEKLKERHEALAQSVELLVAAGHERERRDAERYRQQAERDRRQAEQNGLVATRFREVIDSIDRLVHVAEIHEHRIERLEGTS
jgi:hypothetical protein